ncbi:hypothetical protein OC846_004252 [Tilletia horrida]|uniref:REJ domain-containing protein n=1 Tax=Tilletia horrida TaxID=155126 RepID=A0AAN6GTA8_9BASI|nr:hypothetical protein OC846_004252 [Tilletia horrida]KAK0549480.1 hypothetical protein OC845_003099 [Tilletia horrida]KAK0568942.1 hypothetical protein OC861_001469 [Tilletia horrida]
MHSSSSQKYSALLSVLLLATVLAPAANADLVKRHNHLNLAHRQHQAPAALAREHNLSAVQPEKRLGALLGGLFGGGDKPHSSSSPPAPSPTHSTPPSNNGGGGGGGGGGGSNPSTGGSGSSGGNPTGGSNGGGGNNNGGSGAQPGGGNNNPAPSPSPSPSPSSGSGGDPPSGGTDPGNTGGDGTNPGNTGNEPSTGTGTGTSGTGSNPPPNTTPGADGNNPSPSGSPNGGTKDEGAGKTNGSSGTKAGSGTTSITGGAGSSTGDANGDGYPDVSYGSSASGNTGTDDSTSSSTNKNGNNSNGKSGGSSAGKVVAPILITLIVLAIVVGIASWYWKRVQKRRDAEDRESFSWVNRQGTITADPRRASGESFAGVQRPVSQLSFGNTGSHLAHPSEYHGQQEFGNLPQDMIEVNGWPAVSNVHRGSASGSTPSHQEPSSDDAQHIDQRPGSGLYPFSNGAHEYNPRSEDGINPAYIYASYSEHTHTQGHNYSAPPMGNSLEFQYQVHEASTTEEHGQDTVSPFADAHAAAQYAVAANTSTEEEAQPRRSSEAPYSLDPHISQLERLSGTISPTPIVPGSSRKDSLPPPPSLMAGIGASSSGPSSPTSPTVRTTKPRSGSASSRKAVPSMQSNGRLSVASGSSPRDRTTSIVSGFTVATEEVSHEATKSFTMVGRDLLSPTPEDGVPQFSSSSSAARESIATITAAGSSTRSPFSIASGSISPSRASSEGNPFASPADNSHNYHAAAAAAATAKAAANRNTSVSTSTTGYASDDVLSMRMSHFQTVDPFSPTEDDGTQLAKAKRAISPSDRRPTVSSMAPSESSGRQ